MRQSYQPDHDWAAKFWVDLGWLKLTKAVSPRAALRLELTLRPVAVAQLRCSAISIVARSSRSHIVQLGVVLTSPCIIFSKGFNFHSPNSGTFSVGLRFSLPPLHPVSLEQAGENGTVLVPLKKGIADLSESSVQFIQLPPAGDGDVAGQGRRKP